MGVHLKEIGERIEQLQQRRGQIANHLALRSLMENATAAHQRAQQEHAHAAQAHLRSAEGHEQAAERHERAAAVLSESEHP